MTRPPLELTWYTCRECGDSSCFIDDEIPAKRLTESELLFEYHRAAYLTGIHGPYVEGDRVAALGRLLVRPHAAEGDYQ